MNQNTNPAEKKRKIDATFKRDVFQFLACHPASLKHKKKCVEFGLKVIPSQLGLLAQLPTNYEKGLTTRIKSWTSVASVVYAFDEMRLFLKGKIIDLSPEGDELRKWIFYYYSLNDLFNLKEEVLKISLLHEREGLSLPDMQKRFWSRHYDEVYKKAFFLVRSKMSFVISNKYVGGNKQDLPLHQLALDLLEFAYVTVNRALISPEIETEDHLLNTVKMDLGRKVLSLIKKYKRKKRNVMQKLGKRRGKYYFISTISCSLDDLVNEDGGSTLGEFMCDGSLNALDVLIHQEEQKSEIKLHQ